MAASDPDRAVVLHLVRLIQDSPDVRYCVGGPGTRMRELLAAAGVSPDVLVPAQHHAHEEARAIRLDREVDRLESGLEAIRAALSSGSPDKAVEIVARLQAGDAA